MEPESKVSSCHQHGQWLFFLEMLQGKGRFWLMLAAPGPWSTPVDMEGAEPPALSTQPPVIPCHLKPSAAVGSPSGKLLWLWDGIKATVPCVPVLWGNAAPQASM